jgi:hypothetical protein
VGWKVRCHKSEGIVTMTDPVSPLPLELSAWLMEITRGYTVAH